MRKATINLVMSVRLSTCPHGTSRYHWGDFKWTYCFSIFRKSVEKIKVSLKYDKNNWYFTWRPIYIFWSYLVQFCLEWEMFQTKLYKNSKHAFYVKWSVLENRAVYEIMWKNIVESGRRLGTMWLMRIVCCVPKVTFAHPEYAMLIAFRQQQWLNKRSSMLRYTYIACLGDHT